MFDEHHKYDWAFFVQKVSWFESMILLKIKNILLGLAHVSRISNKMILAIVLHFSVIAVKYKFSY